MKSARWLGVGLVAGMCACGEAPTPESSAAREFDAEIRWTSYGVPHVKARDWASLGYGFAYATATDAICVIARDLVTVNGQQSEFFGPTDEHTESDAFHHAVLTDARLAHQQAGNDERNEAFSRGYIAGYNRYLADHSDNLPSSCTGADWVRAIDAEDLARLTVGVGIRYGLGRFKTAMAQALPPDPQATSAAELADNRIDFSIPAGIGSNAVGFGKAVTESGRGLLFGNPHYPWRGSSRFHLIHTTIPGEVDVMGVSLYTTTRVAIGFNADVAWSHTVSTALRYTLYELKLHPDNPLRYRYGTEYRDIEPRTVTFNVRNAAGELERREQTIYQTHYGPIVVSEQLPWTDKVAYAVRDAVIDNNRSGVTYTALNAATSVADVEAAISMQGVSWTNTVAADRHGSAYYADISNTPNLNAKLLEDCRVEVAALPTSVVVLNGADTGCEWREDPRSAIAGNLPPEEMPRLVREDYVANSNDSYWLSNPAAPLEGYSPIIGPERTARSLRTRAGLTFIGEQIRDGSKVSADDVQNMLHSQRNFGAELLLDDLLTHCERAAGYPEATESNPDISRPCQVLEAWDRRQANTSRGAQVWTEFWRSAREIEGVFAVAFDPAEPVTTPQGLAIDDPVVAAQLTRSLASAATTLGEAGVELDAPWGEVQFARRNDEKIPIPGGQGWAGMWSMIVADLQQDQGYTPIVHGNSYMQIISWDTTGKLDPRGIVTYSQSQEAESPHYADMTHLYSAAQWLQLPFYEADIAADTQRSVHLLE